MRGGTVISDESELKRNLRVTRRAIDWEEVGAAE